MFMVSEAQAAEIRTRLEGGGEFDAMLKFREYFPAIGPEQARECIHTIASWTPREQPERVRRRRKSRSTA